MVGVGALGRHHLRWFSQIPESHLVGFHDIDPEKRERYAAEYGVAAFATVEELAEAVDAASVAVPTTAHRAAAGALLKRGVHCLIEKPVTSTLDEAHELAELAAASGARVEVTVGGRTLVRQVTTAGGYQSGNEPLVHLGLGDASQVERIVVRWPPPARGTTELGPTPARQRLTIQQP